MLSRMKDWVPLGSTGYPFALAINVDDGRKMFRTDSAFHLLRIPKVVGKGGVRSRANGCRSLNLSDSRDPRQK
jgi:hypothetical protein